MPFIQENRLKNAAVILVMGLPASGKTSLARALGEKLGAVHLSSDAIRTVMDKRGQYDGTAKEAVYDEMYRLADEALNAGRRVVLDATFHRAARRERFAGLAEKYGHEPVIILVEASDEITRERLLKKRPDSEADWQVYLLLKSEYEPPSVIGYTVRTDKGTPAEIIADELLTT